MSKILNRALKLAGETKKVGTPVINVLEEDSSGNVTRATGTSVPTDADVGYAVGCRFIKTNGGIGTVEYINEGTAASADFNVVPSYGAASDNEDVTATNVIAATESGRTYFLNSATEFVSTLPAPAAGLRFTFIVKAAPSGASYTIVTASSANIIKGVQLTAQDAGGSGDSGTADDTITFVDGQAVAGDRVDVISDGTSWFAYAYSKVLAGITFTQAS
jgi:hypothetical protein